MLPQDKCDKAKSMLQWMIGKKSATVKELQKLTGTLNFLTKAIFAGRTFTRRMYTNCSATTREGKRLKPYHHVRLDNKFKSDCQIWVNFLINAEENKKILCRPYVDLYTFDSAKTKNFYSDAAKKSNGYGYGAFFDSHWIFGKWEHEFLVVHDPSIEYLELFTLCAGIFTWAERLQNCRIIIFCDNQAVVSMVNNLTSGCKNCMVLLRLLVLNGLYYNRRILVKYVKSRDNILADALSR